MKLKNTTLVCIDCVDVDRAIDSVEICKHYCEFDDIKLFTSLDTDYKYKVEIDNISNLVEYNNFVIEELYKYIDTEYLLIVQWDGFILKPDSWSDEFLEYDYLGAPWELSSWVVGNGGFSLRTKKLMETISKIYKLSPIKINAEMPEDFIICGYLRETLENVYGIKFPSVEVASKFSSEDIGKWNDSFGFHSFKKLDIFEDGWEPPNIEYRTELFKNKLK